MNLSVIGSGKIVHEALPVIAATEGVAVHSIWCREHSLAKAQALAAKYGILQVMTDYDAVLADPQVDTVYVALINSAHYAYALQALKAGKHVILEKPACLHYSELQHLAEEARGRQLMLFEAVTLLHMPAFHLLRDEFLPQLGMIQSVECVYAQRSSRYDAYLRGEVLPAFDPAAGGGALMDINIYNLHFVIALFGKPASARYDCRRGFNGVDLSGTVFLDYIAQPAPLPYGRAGGGSAFLIGAKDADGDNHGLIVGDKGSLRIDGPVSTMASITLTLRGEQPRQVYPAFWTGGESVHRLAPEFAAFVDILHRRDFDTMNRLLDHSLAVAQVVDEIIHSK